MSISYGQLKTKLFASEGRPIALVLENKKKQFSLFVAQLRLSSAKDMRQRNDFFDADIFFQQELDFEKKALLRRELEKYSLPDGESMGLLRTPYTTIYASAHSELKSKRIRFKLCNSAISLGGAQFSVAAVLGRKAAKTLLPI